MPTVSRSVGRFTKRIGRESVEDYRFVIAFCKKWRLGLHATREVQERNLKTVWVRGDKTSETVAGREWILLGHGFTGVTK